MSVHNLELAPEATLALCTSLALVCLVLYEWGSGKYRAGKKTKVDWQMFALSATGVALVEQPLIGRASRSFVEHWAGLSGWDLSQLEASHLGWLVAGFIAIDELLHGWAHLFTHSPPPRNRLLARVHAYYREAHRAHHLVGGVEGHGEVSVTQSIVAGWGWMLALPNYWLGALALSFGLVETWVWGMLFKNLWGMHVHTNWGYDVALLNHRWRWVRTAMRGLCHVLTFPNQHHHHHERGRNSTKNMQNVLALYDWLLWGTLVVEKEMPVAYGWKQRPEERRALVRYFQRPLRVPRRASG